MSGFSFSEPNLVGSPIRSPTIDSSTRDGFLASVKTREQSETTSLKLKCVHCLSHGKGAVPWCNPNEV